MLGLLSTTHVRRDAVHARDCCKRVVQKVEPSPDGQPPFFSAVTLFRNHNT